MGPLHEFIWIFLAACAAGFVFAGLVVIAAWIFERRQHAATRPIRDAAFLAQVSAEVRRG